MRIRIFENIIKNVESRWKLALPAKCYGKRFERSKITKKKILFFHIMCVLCNFTLSSALQMHKSPRYPKEFLYVR